ncbi:MAG: hypothetical protein K0Q51_729 [Rickettsiaceae bacterium]|jgi:hypothetical protein|nr:hypothetical protein [Rickettsiaceae bacterium]
MKFTVEDLRKLRNSPLPSNYEASLTYSLALKAMGYTDVDEMNKIVAMYISFREQAPINERMFIDDLFNALLNLGRKEDDS